jgi:lysophospholipase
MDLANLLPLPPLVFDAPQSLREVDRSYFRFYHIDFENHYPAIEHRFGSLSLAGFDIACHYYCHAQAEATLFVVHGYFDHAGLYRHVIEWGIKNRFSVVAFDLPGHGLSDGQAASIDCFSEYRNVFARLLERFESIADKPWHVIGQSTGGAIVMDYLLRHSEQPFDKVMLLAPLVRPVNWLWVRARLILGRHLFTSVKRHFVENSHSAEFLKFISRQDPLQSKQIAVSWIMALNRWIPEFLNQQSKKHLSPLVVQGTGDETVDWRYNLQVIKEKFPAYTLQELKGARHHLANESSDYLKQLFSALSDFVQAGK